MTSHGDEHGTGSIRPRVVVTRAAEQSSSLASRLDAAGFEPVIVPVIATADAVDGGAALRDAVSSLVERFDWVAVTSPNAADILAAALAAVGESAAGVGVSFAAVGPGTADALAARGIDVALTPTRSIAEGLLDALTVLEPARILLPQAAGARPVLADGLRQRGWDVTVVQAYRTVHVAPSPDVLALASSAEAIVFTSSSTVEAWTSAVGVEATPPVVVSIGPATSATVRQRGLTVTAEAQPHTLDGVVAAVKTALT